VLFPRNADEQSQVRVLGEVEQPGRRHGVRAHGVDASLRHRREVVGDEAGVVKLIAPLVGREGPVRDAAEVQLLPADLDELPGCANAQPGLAATMPPCGLLDTNPGHPQCAASRCRSRRRVPTS